MEPRIDLPNRLPLFPSAQEDENADNKVVLSKSDQTYTHIKNLILTAALKPGQRIYEDELATMLHASRTPVRDALRRLSNDGLITIYPKRYTEVTVFSPEAARTLGIVRISQDILAGRLAIYYGSDADFSQLQQMSKKCEELASVGDLCGRIAADGAFHLKITEIGKNALLMKYQQELYLRLHLLMIQYAASWDDRVERASHHQNLTDALIRRDESALIATIKHRYQELYGLDPKIVDMCCK